MMDQTGIQFHNLYSLTQDIYAAHLDKTYLWKKYYWN